MTGQWGARERSGKPCLASLGGEVESKNCGREATLFGGGGQASDGFAERAKRANDIASQMCKKWQGSLSNPEGRHPTTRLASWPRHTGSTRVIGHSLTLRQICTSGQFCTAPPPDSLLWGVLHNAALQLCLFDYRWGPAGHSRRHSFTASPRICFPALPAYGSFWMRWFDQFLWRVTFAKPSILLCKRSRYPDVCFPR